MKINYVIKYFSLFLLLNINISCSVPPRSDVSKRLNPIEELRLKFKVQEDKLSLELKNNSLVGTPRKTKKIVSLFLNKESHQDEMDMSFRSDFNTIYEYYQRTQYWVEQFDRKLVQIKNSQVANPDASSNGFLERSYEYNILQVLRVKQDENIDNIIKGYEFLLRSYYGFASENSKLNLEEKLKKSIVAAKFLIKLNALEIVWRAEFPLIYDKIHQHRLELNENIEEEFESFIKLEEGREFNEAKRKVLAEIPELEYDRNSPSIDLPDIQIEIAQKSEALKGENISQMINKDEILLLENTAFNFFGDSIDSSGFLDSPMGSPDSQRNALESVSAVKCIKPSMESAGNISGSEFPKNNWVLTLDDGPSSRYTRQFLQYLRDDQVKASFFMVGRNMSALKSIVRDVDADEHVIASHSWSHANLPKISESKLDHEIAGPNVIYQAILNRKPKFFRCPYGAGFRNPAIRQRLVNLGLVHVLWNVDTLDWQDRNPTSIIKRTLDSMEVQKRGIILFHDVHPQSLAASRELLTKLKLQKDLRWLTIQDAMDTVNKGRGCPVDVIP
jgi:peptidoglycan/xylan/chitin deacetylase (PgdA/CDA1 family)